MTLRTGYAKKINLKSNLAEIKTSQFIKDKNKKNAKIIAELVSDYFNIPVDAIRTNVKHRGSCGKCRRILTCLLLECLPWSHSEISHFMNFTNRTSVTFHLKKLKNDEELQTDMNVILMRLIHLIRMPAP
jgi:chromosomal replication initiation ATPase DnaA